MAEIKRVAIAGVCKPLQASLALYYIILIIQRAQKGRIGTPVMLALVKAGFETTILTRFAQALQDLPADVQTREVDYDSDESLKSALRGQDAVVSTVAMSAITNQKRMIDAAIDSGVKHFIPAEFTVESRHPDARRLPLLASIIDIQDYLTARQDRINWTVINSGAAMEFAFDPPFILDFDNHAATLWDGGDGAVSLSNFGIIAEAVVGVLKQAHRVQDHCVHVHGTTLTQKEALRIARKYSTEQWSVVERDAAAAVEESMAAITSGSDMGPEGLMASMLTLISAMTFGKGHFDGAYKDPDNAWLGVTGAIDDRAVENAIHYRLQKGKAGHATGENLTDVADQLAAKYDEAKS